MRPLHNKSWLIRWSVGFILLCQLQALSVIDRILYGQWVGKGGDKLTQTINLMQIVLGVALFLKGTRQWKSLKSGALMWLALAMFAITSAAWSVDFGATMRAGIQYLVLIITAIGIAESLEAEEFMDLLARVCFLSAIVSMVLLIISPQTVIGEFAGDYRGVFPQKNPLGQAMAMGTIACLHGIMTSKRGRLFRIIMIATFTLVTLRAASATSLLTMALFIVLGSALNAAKKRGSVADIVLKGALIIAPPIMLIFFFNQSVLLEMMGKDATLTGRTDIWEYVIPDIYQRPVLGWGYAAFWSVGNPAAVKISETLRWWVPQAHNGVLEILLSIGFVGLILYVIMLGRTWLLSVRCLPTPNRQIGATCLLTCVGVIVIGVSENVLLYTGGITLVFLVTGFYCERALWLLARRGRWPAGANLPSLAAPPPRAKVLVEARSTSARHFT
jgi:exopolysaccharide production protein ExoQ